MIKYIITICSGILIYTLSLFCIKLIFQTKSHVLFDSYLIHRPFIWICIGTISLLIGFILPFIILKWQHRALFLIISVSMTTFSFHQSFLSSTVIYILITSYIGLFLAKFIQNKKLTISSIFCKIKNTITKNWESVLMLIIMNGFLFISITYIYIYFNSLDKLGTTTGYIVKSSWFIITTVLGMVAVYLFNKVTLYWWIVLYFLTNLILVTWIVLFQHTKYEISIYDNFTIMFCFFILLYKNEYIKHYIKGTAIIFISSILYIAAFTYVNYTNFTNALIENIEIAYIIRGLLQYSLLILLSIFGLWLTKNWRFFAAIFMASNCVFGLGATEPYIIYSICILSALLLDYYQKEITDILLKIKK